ncbi:MAG: o-succinylbenzoate--CoA ligase [Pseudonocardia sp.]|nr:o-succinylbenzoate--CoA ligase [Pseudonocardia sp.]
MTERTLRVVPVDGSPQAVAGLAGALDAAISGAGPAVLPVSAAAPALAEAGPPAQTVPADVAVVVATSGSTGEPKHVALTAEALRASALATEARLGGPGRWLLTLPAEHVAGIQVLLRAVLAGAEPVVQDVREGFRPAGFARATGRFPHGARRYTSLVPTQLARILDDDDDGAARHALAGYGAVLVGGAALDAGLRERAEDAGVTVVTTYGMSETCGGCVYDGVPLDGVTVGIEPTGPDPADTDPDTGRVVLGGPTLAAGYLPAGYLPDGHLAAPDGESAAFSGGVFRTGDLGRWRAGRLTVLGRVDDMVNTGGEKVAPAAVERALLTVPGVRGACAVGLPDPEWGQVVAAMVVADEPYGAREDAGPDDDALRSAVRAAEGRAAVPRLLVRAERIPERGIGKPDRATVARVLEGVRAT